MGSKICSGSIAIVAFIFHFRTGSISLSLSLSDCILAITSVVAPKMMNVYSRHSYRTLFFICMWVTVCICIYIYNMRERCEMVLCIFFGYYVVRMILWGLNWQSNTIYSVRASDRTQQQYKATAQNTYTPNQFFAVKYNSGHMRFNTKYLKLYCTSVHNYGCSSTGNSSSSSRIAFVHIIERKSIYFLPEYENKNEKKHHSTSSTEERKRIRSFDKDEIKPMESREYLLTFTGFKRLSWANNNVMCVCVCPDA